MSGFWKAWLRVWVGAVAAFGLLLASGAIEATDAPLRALIDLLGGDGEPFDRTHRFAFGLMGCVSLGWALTLATTIRAAEQLGEAGGPIWRGMLVSVVVWFVTDSALSIYTGFGLNALSNMALLLGLLAPLLATGVLRR